jgi:hypothetical protein
MNGKFVLAVLSVCCLLTGCAKAPHQAAQPTVSPASSSTVPPRITESSSSGITRSASPSQLKSILTEYTTHRIISFQSFSSEITQSAAFALDDGGNVWYVTASGAQKLQSDIYISDNDPSAASALWTVDGTVIFKCEDIPGGSSTRSYAWYVKDGVPMKLPFVGMGLTYIGKGQFTTIGDTFDSVLTDGMKAGHTYKIYYLYWTENGLKEYGGLGITQEQLLGAKGSREILQAITKSDHTIDSIYYRANNIININYHTGNNRNGYFDNVTLSYHNYAVTPILANPDCPKAESFNEKDLRDFSYGGIYRAALYSDIAAYPEKFPER